jgi:uncharacterized protein YecE (DUF72 family)
MTTIRKIHVGTCSWAEKTLIASGEFYPKGTNSAEERLKYYASHFDTVEVDSTYYAIPAVRTAELWASRTPENFQFHIKAYGALTGHGVNPQTLPKSLRAMLSPSDREKRTIHIADPSFLKDIADAFAASLQPLRAAGKLGVLVVQYPPWFWYKKENLDTILTCRELMGGIPLAVEFRHGSWLTHHHLESTLHFLRENGITYITTDEPQFGSLATVPFLPAVTTDIAYLRLHGRNTRTWLQKGIETSLRYDYLYSAEELREFVGAAASLSAKAGTTYLMFNNCHGGFAVRNALDALMLLEEAPRE